MVRKYYKTIEHPADLKMKVFGESLPELFCNLAKAIAEEQLGSQASKRERGKGREKEEVIALKASDLFSLFVNFANEIIYRSDANGKIYTDCEIIEHNKSRRSRQFVIKARISGKKAGKKIDIKAATYHEGYVKETDEGWESVILFDV